MRHQSHSDAIRVPIDAGRQVAQLRHVLQLVDEFAGNARSGLSDAALDEAARITAWYHEAEPVVQRRFDALAIEMAAWSAAGVEALLAAGSGCSPAATRRLADELERGLSQLVALLRPAAAPVAGRAIPSP